VNDQIITAIIAGAGVLLSASISFATGRRQARIETDKMRANLQNEFGARVFEKRLDTYPQYYMFISDYIKMINWGVVTRDGIAELLETMQNWDSRNAIFLGAAAHKSCSELRHHLRDLLDLSDDEVRTMFSGADQRADLKSRMQQAELALKEELGIFMFRSPARFVEGGQYSTYADAHRDAYSHQSLSPKPLWKRILRRP